jgi:putative phosphoribosyl transferase
VFDIALLARRLAEATTWLRAQPSVKRTAIGYFGASTGAAAALWAAAEPGAGIAAVVSRGGRPDLARPRLAAVTSPVLLIVGGDDQVVLDLNRRAQAELRCENDLAVVPGASHLFEEPGTLDAAAALARDWFVSHLAHQPA